MDSQQIREKLAEPFAASDIEWRVQRAGMNNGSPWAHVIPYLTARAVQERLDDVFGLDGWVNKYKPAPDGGVLCGITVWIEGNKRTKWDGAENTNIEAVKGGISDSFKRAGVVLGIGRYLYKTGTYFAICHENKNTGQHRQKFVDKYDKDAKPLFGSWDEPALPDFALPYHIQDMRLQSFIKQINDAENAERLHYVFGKAYKWAKEEMQNVDYCNKAESAYKVRKNNFRVDEAKEDK